MKPESFLPPEVIAALESGRTVEAIQLLRDLRGLGLAEAKSAVQQYLDRRQTPPSAPPPGGGGLPPQAVDALQRGNKIEAIRRLREDRGLDLRDAKREVDAWEASHVAADPGLAPGEQKRSSALFWFVLVAAGVAYLLYRVFGAGG